MSAKIHLQKNTVKSSESGFSLLEIVIVLGIIGTIFGLVINNIVKNRDQSNVQLSAARAQTLQGKLLQYQLDHDGKFPTTEQGLASLVENGTGGISLANEEDLKDAWGHPFAYKLTMKGPVLISGGKDGNTTGAGAICYLAGKKLENCNDVNN